MNKYLSKLAELTEKDKEELREGKSSYFVRPVGYGMAGGVAGSLIGGRVVGNLGAGAGAVYGLASAVQRNKYLDQLKSDHSKTRAIHEFKMRGYRD